MCSDFDLGQSGLQRPRPVALVSPVVIVVVSLVGLLLLPSVLIVAFEQGFSSPSLVIMLVMVFLHHRHVGRSVLFHRECSVTEATLETVQAVA